MDGGTDASATPAETAGPFLVITNSAGTAGSGCCVISAGASNVADMN
ncbi:MAG: hypothetical protein M3P94_01950 [Chloroflexota bacterium]|nr:hypothetical protein [Chloroflexota bacterium]